MTPEEQVGKLALDLLALVEASELPGYHQLAALSSALAAGAKLLGWTKIEAVRAFMRGWDETTVGEVQVPYVRDPK